MEKVKISTEYIKLDQFLKWVNVVGQGSDAKDIIQDGFVKVVNPVREIELKGLQLSILMISDENGIRLLTPGYDNIQLEKKYTFD